MENGSWSSAYPEKDGWYFWLQVGKDDKDIVNGGLSQIAETDGVRGWKCSDGKHRDAHLSKPPISQEMEQYFVVLWKEFDPNEINV